MAISGLHIAMVAAVFAWLGGRLQRWRQRRGATGATRDAAVVAGALAALGYSLLAGWSVPTQRTMVMIACGAAALLLRRRVGVADGLGLCVIGVLLLDPLAPLAPGFWLSFGAVAAILYGATGHVRPLGLLRSYLLVQVVVTLGLVPVLAGSFGSVSLGVGARQPVRDPALHAADRAGRAGVVRRAPIVPAARARSLLDWTGRLIEATWPLIEVPASWPLADVVDRRARRASPGSRLVLGTLAALSPLPLAGSRRGWRARRDRLPVAAAPVAGRCRARDDPRRRAGPVGRRRNAPPHARLRRGSVVPHAAATPGSSWSCRSSSRGIRTLDRLVVSHDDDDHKGGAAQRARAVCTRAPLIVGPEPARRRVRRRRAQR